MHVSFRIEQIETVRPVIETLIEAALFGIDEWEGTASDERTERWKRAVGSAKRMLRFVDDDGRLVKPTPAPNAETPETGGE
jgi:hypothetical protein